MNGAILSLADYQAIRPELVLVMFGLALLLIDRLLRAREKYWNAITALVGLGFSGVQLARFWTSLPGDHVITAFAAGFTLDAFSLYFKFIVVLAAAVAVLISAKYLDIERAHSGTYYALLLFCAAGMMLLVSSTDLIVLFLALELVAACQYLLAGFLRANRRSNEAGLKFFLLGAFASALLLYGMSLLYGVTGATNFSLIQQHLAHQSGNHAIVWIAAAIVLAGLYFKLGAVPFHQWAPDVYEGAPTSVTALISVGPLATSLAVLVRFLLAGSPSMRAEWRALTIGVAAASLVLGNLAALTQTNIKRFFGYSTISHAGYLLLGIVAALTQRGASPDTSRDGLTAILVYVAVYAFMSLGFVAVIIVLRRRTLAGDEIDDLAGLTARSPGYAALLLAFLLSLSGIPPTAGFVGKFFIFRALVATAHAKLAFLGVFFAVVAAYCYFRIAVVMFTKKAPDGIPLAVGPGISVALALTLGLTVAVGIYPQPMIDMAQTAVQSLF